MSNPYSAPTLSGYNASSTPDTDTVAYSWALHKNEIGDPIKTYLDSLKSAISTAFESAAFSAVSTKTDNYTILSTDQGALIVFSGTANKTFTLPAASVGANFMVSVLNLSSFKLTIDGATSETINGSTTLVLGGYGNHAILVSDGSSWRTALATDKMAPEIKFVTSNQAHSSPLSTTYEDITELSGFVCRRNKVYEAAYCIAYSFGVAELNITAQFNTVGNNPAAGIIIAADELSAGYINGSGPFGTLAAPGLGDSAANNEAIAYAKGSVRLGTTGGADGTFDLQFRNTFADSEAPVILAGSWCYVREIYHV